jgi:hypothetical protein
MLDEILRDTASGHRVLATVFVECMSMYPADGPEALRPVGETEFVNRIVPKKRERIIRGEARRGENQAPVP